MLSERLYTLAKGIHPGETMADIGTDHGFLPGYLIENHISPWAIAVDVSADSLKKAENLGLEKISCRLGDGIKVLEPGEVDVIVMAGMGGILISEILGYDLKKTKTFKRFILQPRSKVGYLRKWLKNEGFTLAHETLVEEGDNLCEILTVVPEEACHYDYPFDLINCPNEFTGRYLDIHIAKHRYILDSISNTESNGEKISEVKKTIEHLQHLKKLFLQE